MTVLKYGVPEPYFSTLPNYISGNGAMTAWNPGDYLFEHDLVGQVSRTD